MSTVFVVNADDFGLSAEVNAGILQAFDHGVVTSTSVMTNMPHHEAIVDAARPRSDLGVGLHLCLTEGRPLLEPSRVHSLVGEQGEFLSRKELLHRIRAGRVDWTEVAAETRAQADRLIRLGVRTDHWNSHQYVHLEPRLQSVVRAVLRPEQFPCMRTHRRAYVSPSGWLRGAALAKLYGRMPSRWVKDVYFGFQHRRAAREGFALPDAQLTRVPFRGAYSVLTENVTLHAGAGVFEWICHPSTSRRAEDRESMDRPGELRLLVDPALRESIDRAGMRLSTFAAALGLEATV